MKQNGNAKDTLVEGAGGLTLAARAGANPRWGAGKKISKKHAARIRAYCKAEQAAAEREAKEWLIKHGLFNDVQEDGREAAYADLVTDELCWDLAGKYACESVERRGGDVGEIRHRYEAIVIELVCARTSDALIHEDAADPLTLERLEQWLYAATKAPAGYEMWPELGRMPERSALLGILPQEYVRDRNTLMKFLRAVFKRHRKIGEEHSTWRAQLCSHQLAAEYAPKQIALELERGSVVPQVKTANQFEALRARVRKYLKRG